MTPFTLLLIVLALAVIRVAIALRPVVAGAPSPSVVKEYLDSFIVSGLVALALITFVVRTFYIPSASMVPTLKIHDVLLVNEFQYRFVKPHDGDVAVFTPAVPSPDDFIKRTIAGPGERLRITDGTVYRNGAAIDEPYVNDRPDYDLVIKNYGIYVNGYALDRAEANIPPKAMWSAPDRIPDGCYFMMGDNRNDSEDSHVWGFAQLGGTFASGPRKGERAGFTGHAFVVFWPVGRMRVL